MWKVVAMGHVALMLFLVSARLWHPAVGPPMWYAVGIGFIGGVWMWQLSRRRHFILVSPDSIRIVGRSSTPEVYRMSDVAKAQWSFVSGDVRIERADESEITTIKRRFLGSNLRMLRLVKTIRRYTRAEVEVIR